MAAVLIKWTALGAAAALGCFCRYGCTKMLERSFSGFPWGTLAVNVSGAFLAGFLFVLCRARFPQYEEFFPILFVGFLGAYTTFSTFALESSRFLFGGQYFRFFADILLQNGIGIAAASAGFLLAHHLFR